MKYTVCRGSWKIDGTASKIVLNTEKDMLEILDKKRGPIFMGTSDLDTLILEEEPVSTQEPRIQWHETTLKK